MLPPTIRAALALSNARYAELIASSKHADQEAARVDFYGWLVDESAAGRSYADWQEAWHHYAPTRATRPSFAGKATMTQGALL